MSKRVAQRQPPLHHTLKKPFTPTETKEQSVAISSDDEDDYMSEKFAIVQSAPIADTKTDLKKKFNEKEERERGLSTAIDSGNKGFRLLQKMGFTPGSSLGLDTTSGITQPVEIIPSSGRSGLGVQKIVRVDERCRKQAERQQIEAERALMDDRLRHVFKNRMGKDAVARKIHSDLIKSRMVVEQLDLQRSISRHCLWPPQDDDALAEEFNDDEPTEVKTFSTNEDAFGSDDSEDEQQPTFESSVRSPPRPLPLVTDPSVPTNNFDLLPRDFQLKVVTNYLRSQYFYCHWCGTGYDSSTDMTSNCPGDAFELH